MVGRDSVEPISPNCQSGANGATAFGMRQPAAALSAAVRMGCSLEVIERRPPLSLLHYPTSAGGQRAAKKWQPSDSVSKFDMLGLWYA